MNNKWKVFDDVEEMVCISLFDTKEIVYLNKTALSYLELDNISKLDNKTYPLGFASLKKSLNKDNPISLVANTVEISNKLYLIEIEDKCSINDHELDYPASFLGKCLWKLFIGGMPNQSINNLLEYLGVSLNCDRSYVFELKHPYHVSNTYEWCKSGVTKQIDKLTDLSLDSIDWWIDAFKKGDSIIIDDVEKIKDNYPFTYAVLCPQDINSLIAVPIFDEYKALIGLVGLDNPMYSDLLQIEQILKKISNFLTILIYNRNSLESIERECYRDSLTGCYNENALWKYCKSDNKANSLGFLVVELPDYNTLKGIIGENSQDELIVMINNRIRNFSSATIYRSDKNKFVAVFENQSEHAIEQNATLLKSSFSDYNLLIAYAYTENKNVDKAKLLLEANANLRRSLDSKIKQSANVDDINNKQLLKYLEGNYFNVESLISSLTGTSHSLFLYFGDLTTNVFYISDNTRDLFGFESNIVYDLISEWEKRIVRLDERMKFKNDLARIIKNKEAVHDLHYQVRDVNGLIRWIHCHGIIKWDENKDKPIFFSGCITKPEDNFLIDPITHFPRDASIFKALDSVSSSVPVIAFQLNHLKEINRTYGRSFADKLLERISIDLTECYKNNYQFCRLEGTKFMAISLDGNKRSVKEDLVEMSSLISSRYQSFNLLVTHPVTMGVVNYDPMNDDTYTLIENCVILLSSTKDAKQSQYVEIEKASLSKIKENANITLALNSDVANQMRNFRVVIQPVVDAKTLLPIGGEVLLRWKYDGRDVSPAMFIPILERTHNIVQVGRWVFEQAVKNCKAILVHNPDFYLTFNVSYLQILDDNFINFMIEIINKYGVQTKNLVAELTETNFDDHPEKLKVFVEACNKIGIKIALDDFGNAYSSLGLLLKYPANIIKLDRSLLVHMGESEDKLNFISSIVYACHKFGKKVCVEGVETKLEADMIKEAGCDIVQGYYFYKPLEIIDIFNLISKL